QFGVGAQAATFPVQVAESSHSHPERHLQPASRNQQAEEFLLDPARQPSGHRAKVAAGLPPSSSGRLSPLPQSPSHPEWSGSNRRANVLGISTSSNVPVFFLVGGLVEFSGG